MGALRPGTSMCDVDFAGQRNSLGEVDHSNKRRGLVVDEEQRRPNELREGRKDERSLPHDENECARGQSTLTEHF